MRHAILGAGGVGGLIAACLAKSGDSVVLVVRPEAVSGYPSTLILESPFGNFDVAVEITAEVPAVDLVWIAVKATQLQAALRALPSGTPVRAIIPLMNGIEHVALLRDTYGAGRVVPATIAVESERVSAGHIIHRSPFARLNVSSAGIAIMQDSLERLKKVGFTCQFVDDEATLIWSKLVFLAPLALVSTASGKTTGEMAADPLRRVQIEQCVQEACAVALTEYAKVDAASVMATIHALPGHMRSSMQKDVEQNRPPELDAIGGAIVRRAQQHSLEVPMIRRLIAEVEQKIRT